LTVDESEMESQQGVFMELANGGGVLLRAPIAPSAAALPLWAESGEATADESPAATGAVLE